MNSQHPVMEAKDGMRPHPSLMMYSQLMVAWRGRAIFFCDVAVDKILTLL